MFENCVQAKRVGCQLKLGGIVLNMLLFALNLPSSDSHATPTTTKAESAGPYRASPETTAPLPTPPKSCQTQPDPSHIAPQDQMHCKECCDNFNIYDIA